MYNEIDFNFKNIDFKLIKTSKYKTVTGIISFVKPLEKKDFTYYSLLNRLIGSSSINYPTKKDLSNKMFQLYDCSVYMSTSYSYKSANSFFVFQTVNDKYVENKNIVKECIDLLKEIMFNPLIEGIGFNRKNFNEEVKALENDIKNIYNNKKKYSFRKLMEFIAPNDIISSSTLGELDVLSTITPENLYDFYIDLLNNSYVNIGIIGDVDQMQIEKYFSEFEFKSKKHDLEIFPKNVNFKEKTNMFFEYQDIVQAKLMMGFRYDIDYKSDHYIPLIIFNAMFGGMFGSSLFMTIREKHSLTYDISSEMIINKKIMIVSCGVDKKNIELTSDLVIKELEEYKRGNIDSNLLKIAKEFLINDLKEMQDLQFSSLAFKLENTINCRPSIEEIIDKIEKTEIDDIIKVSNMINLDTIFNLLPGDVYE